MKTLGLLIVTVLFSGCVTKDDYNKLDARLSVVEARYYALDEDNKKVHEYLDKNYETMKKSFAAARKNQDDIRQQLNEHDKQIKSWQQPIQQ